MDNNSTFHIRHSSPRSEIRDRVMLTERRVLLLPSHPSDSGTYTYIFRSDLTDNTVLHPGKELTLTLPLLTNIL